MGFEPPTRFWPELPSVRPPNWTPKRVQSEMKTAMITHSKFYLYIQKQKIKFLTLYTDITYSACTFNYIICTQEKYT